MATTFVALCCLDRDADPATRMIYDWLFGQRDWIVAIKVLVSWAVPLGVVAVISSFFREEFAVILVSVIAPGVRLSDIRIERPLPNQTLLAVRMQSLGDTAVCRPDRLSRAVREIKQLNLRHDLRFRLLRTTDSFEGAGKHTIRRTVPGAERKDWGCMPVGELHNFEFVSDVWRLARFAIISRLRPEIANGAMPKEHEGNRFLLRSAEIRFTAALLAVPLICYFCLLACIFIATSEWAWAGNAFLEFDKIKALAICLGLLWLGGCIAIYKSQLRTLIKWELTHTAMPFRGVPLFYLHYDAKGPKWRELHAGDFERNFTGYGIDRDQFVQLVVGLLFVIYVGILQVIGGGASPVQPPIPAPTSIWQFNG